MEIQKCSIEGLYVIRPKVLEDERGSFFESFRLSHFEQTVGSVNFVQENESRSQRGVFRGLHFQKAPKAQSKLIRCARGRILDIVVDLRSNSPTRGRFEVLELSAENRLSLFVPVGFGHGFLSLEDNSVVQYKTSDYYSPQDESGLSIDCIDFQWPIPRAEWKLTSKDQTWPDMDKVYLFD
jgi:dTDP-4-dehydrorhamnose 3,5-epimerase